MTRKDFQLIADTLSLAHEHVERTSSGDDWVDAERHVAIELTTRLMADQLGADNPRFDRTRFLRAAHGDS